MITTLLILITTILTAPANNRLFVQTAEPLRISDIPYLTFAKEHFKIKEPFLKSVVGFESNFDIYAINLYTGARGILQYMPIMIREVNKIDRKLYPQNQTLEPAYTWDDAFNPYKSIEMYWLFMNYKNPEYYPDKAIRLWFGSGRQYDGMTWCDYYNEVMN